MVAVAGSTLAPIAGGDDVWGWGDEEAVDQWCSEQDDAATKANVTAAETKAEPAETKAEPAETKAEPAETAVISTPGEFLVFDKETGPQDDESLKTMLPEFVAPEPPGPFDESTVKLGNLKKPELIREKIEKAREEHAASVANYDSDVAKARASHWEDFKGKAALNATTGRLVAIGMWLAPCGPRIIDCDGDREEDGLRDFWNTVEACLKCSIPMIGFNSNSFDIPFAIRRSWILGVPIPVGVRVGRYLNPLFIDLMRVWALDGRDMVGLDTLAKAFGLPAKVKEVEVDGVKVAVSGATFYQLWRSNRVVAEKYLARDLEIPAKLARLMGVV